MNDLGSLLMAVYAGRTDVHGVQTAKVWMGDDGVRHREASWLEKSEPVTDALVEHHLAGRTTIGVYLLRQDSTCAFAVWDFDGGDKASVHLVWRVLTDAGIDALLFDSGKKGYHLVSAFAEPVPGTVAHAFARTIWQRAGAPEKVEAFPKQGTVTPERPFGNLIKLPLGIHRATGRRCALLTADFVPVIEGTEADELRGLRRVLRTTIDAIVGDVPEPLATRGSVNGRSSPVSTSFVRVPYPCFADLSTARYRDGERNTLLFTLTKHLHRQGQPQAFAELVAAAQGARCVAGDGRTPAPYPDTQAVVENVYQHGYTSLGCEEPAMRAFCKGAVCALYQRDESVIQPAKRESEEDDTPRPSDRTVTLENVIQIGWEEPEYEITVCGTRIARITTTELDSWPRFRKLVMAPLRFIPELPRVGGMRVEDVWRSLVNSALETSVLEERPGNTSSGADVIDLALDWLRHGADVSEKRADVLTGALWRDTDTEGRTWVYFTARYLLAAIRGRSGPLTSRELYDALRRVGGGGINVRVGERSRWLWRLPAEVIADA